MLTDKKQKEWIESENCWSNDLQTYQKKLYNIVNNSKLSLRILGKITSDRILLISPSTINLRLKRKNFLVTAGFHGEEPVGSWAILRYLTSEYDSQYNVSFIPIVNPTGFKKGERVNIFGEKTNAGFLEDKEDGKTSRLSHEGKILMKHIKLLKELSKDGFLTLHEYSYIDYFCLYTFGEYNPSNLYSSLKNYFTPVPNGYIDSTYNSAKATDGIVKNFHDGSFEDYMAQYSAKSVNSETPGTKDIEERIKAQVDVIKTFVGE